MKKIWRNEEGVSPVIAVILMVAITVVLAAVLYVMVSGMMTSTETTPRGSLLFSDDPNVSGRYTGTFQGSVKLEKVDISLYDASVGSTAVSEQPASGANISVAGGAYLVFTDTNTNDKLDATDSMILNNGGSGDRVTIVYRSTGETVATYTLN